MKIEFVASSETWDEEHDFRQFYQVKVNDEILMRFLDGEPEDANLSRDFQDVHLIPNLVREIMDAMKAGEEITIIRSISDELD